MNWKSVAKGILKGIQIPIFSPIPIVEEVFFNAVEEEKNQQWKTNIEGLISKIDYNFIKQLGKLESSTQFLILSQIPQSFPNEVKESIQSIIMQANNTSSFEKQQRLAIDFWQEIASVINSIDEKNINLLLEAYLRKNEKQFDEIKSRLVSLTPISVDLLDELNKSVKYCSDKNIPYQTPNLLLALFSISDSLAKRCFNKLSPTLGEEYHKKFDFYINVKQPAKIAQNVFKPFDWKETEWVQLAQLEAFNEEYPIVTEKHLLLGVLQSTGSETVDKLKGKLGDNFQQLLILIRNEPSYKRPKTDISDIL